MEDLIDIRNRKEQKNIIKWYNCNYDMQKNIIGDENDEIYLPLELEEPVEEKAETAEKLNAFGEPTVPEPTDSYAADVLSRINQARDDKLMAAIMEGMEE